MPEIWFPNLGIQINKLNAIAFSIFNLEIYWYGLIITVGLCIGLLIAQKEAIRTNQDPEFYLDSLIYGLLFSLMTARLYYVAFSWDYFKDNLDKIFSIRDGGIAIYGAIIGGCLFMKFYTGKKDKNFLQVTDTWAMGLILGQSIGRWGNFVNREAYGTYTDSLFAMRYIKSQAKGVPQSVADNSIILEGIEYIQVHPTFLYESIWNLLIFLIIFLYRKNKKFHGELTCIYFIGYGIGRYFIEGLRTDALLIGNTGIAISQVVSIIFIIVFGIAMIYKRRTNK